MSLTRRPMMAVKPTFRSVAIPSALVFLSLAFAWMFAPGAVLSSWGAAFPPQAGLMARRGAALYTGIGVMLLAARNAEPSPARSALAAGLVVACSILAVLGIFELTTGHAGRGISVAVVIEAGLTLAFLSVARARKANS